MAFLLAGHVLATTGLCIVTTAGEPVQTHASSTACPEHGPQGEPGHGSTVKHHCPAEEPSPQSRSADLPGAQPIAAIASVHVHLLALPVGRLLQPTPDHQVPPPPLYARLQRLRL